MILPDLLGMLASRFPRLQVTTATGNAEEMLADLAERRIEMCLLTEGVNTLAGVTFRQVGSVSVGLLVRAGHPLADRSGLTLSDIKEFPLATGSFSGRTPGISSQLEPTIVCENYHILRDMVLRSDAIWLSSSALRSNLEQPDLIELDLADYPVAHFAILLLRMEQRTPSHAGEAIETAIEEILSRVA